MWLWHALEELEHKSVTYAVYDVIGNRLLERRLALSLVLTVVLPAVIASSSYLLVRRSVWRRRGDLRHLTATTPRPSRRGGARRCSAPRAY